jgi:hypothetical protein
MNFYRTHGATPQKIVPFIVKALRTPNPVLSIRVHLLRRVHIIRARARVTRYARE